jgi:hypothetical protein
MKALRAIVSKYSPADLVAAGRTLLADSVRQDVLASIRQSLVLFDGLLLNTLNGEYRQVVLEDGRSQAEALAQAARKLANPQDLAAGILLLLPPADFLSTHYQLALKGDSLLRSALKLQAHTLIPAYDHELLLGLNGQSGEGTALWYPARNADELFMAFQAEGLFLAAVMPRTLALGGTMQREQDLLLLDEDSRHVAQFELHGGVLHSVCMATQRDLQQQEFAEQWQAETAKAAPGLRLRSQGHDYWSGRREVVEPMEPYCFFPKGAEHYGRRLLQQKQKRFAAMAAGVVVALLFLPFVANWAQATWLESQIEELRADSAAARQSQAAVYAMEDEWGALADYPRQDVAQTLLTLNQYINSSLTDFSLEEGVVDLTGYAQDPALLVEQLSEREEFFEVSQSRSSSGGEGGARGDRFGIRLRLSGADFGGYDAKYPPVQK